MITLYLPDRTTPALAFIDNGRLTVTSDEGDWLQIEGLSLDHILHGDEPGVVRVERRERRTFVERGLTLQDLDPALGPVTLKAMLAEHFILIGLPDIAEAVMMDYRALTKKDYKPKAAAAPDNQLADDLARIEPIIGDLLDDEGRLVYGGQARIAEALGIENGGAYRKRILAVRDALVREAA